MALTQSRRQRTGGVSGLLGAAALAAWCGNVLAQNAGAPDEPSGEELFRQFCSACHGPGARGDGPVARTLNVAVPDLTRLSLREGRFPADDVRATIDGRSLAIAHGTRVMPIWGYQFWVDEGADIGAEAQARSLINRLVAYLESIQAGDESERRP